MEIFMIQKFYLLTLLFIFFIQSCSQTTSQGRRGLASDEDNPSIPTDNTSEMCKIESDRYIKSDEYLIYLNQSIKRLDGVKNYNTPEIKEFVKKWNEDFKSAKKQKKIAEENLKNLGCSNAYLCSSLTIHNKDLTKEFDLLTKENRDDDETKTRISLLGKYLINNEKLLKEKNCQCEVDYNDDGYFTSSDFYHLVYTIEVPPSQGRIEKKTYFAAHVADDLKIPGKKYYFRYKQNSNQTNYQAADELLRYKKDLTIFKGCELTKNLYHRQESPQDEIYLHYPLNSYYKTFYNYGSLNLQETLMIKYSEFKQFLEGLHSGVHDNLELVQGQALSFNYAKDKLDKPNLKNIGEVRQYCHSNGGELHIGISSAPAITQFHTDGITTDTLRFFCFKGEI